MLRQIAPPQCSSPFGRWASCQTPDAKKNWRSASLTNPLAKGLGGTRGLSSCRGRNWLVCARCRDVPRLGVPHGILAGTGMCWPRRNRAGAVGEPLFPACPASIASRRRRDEERAGDPSHPNLLRVRTACRPSELAARLPYPSGAQERGRGLSPLPRHARCVEGRGLATRSPVPATCALDSGLSGVVEILCGRFTAKAAYSGRS
jgi:hypothetical protein